MESVVEGKIIRYLGEQSGTSKAGKPWKKKEWVLETFSQYPRNVKFHIFGDKADTMNLEVGKDYTLYIDIESREFNERWYTDISVYRAQEYVPSGQNGYPSQGNYPQPGNYAPQGGYQGMPSQQPASTAPFGSESQAAYGGNFTGNQGFSPASPENDEDLPF